MARKLTAGISGKNVLGSMVAVDNSLRTVVLNADIALQPNGTGVVSSAAHLNITSGNSVRMFDDDSSQYIALKAPADVSANVTLTFPATAGSSGQVLSTNGSGVLSWAATEVAIANNTTDNAAHYPTITTATSGGVSSLRVTSSKLSFVPSTGLLTATGLSADTLTITGAGTTAIPNVDINGGNIDGTTIGAATAAAGTFTTMTATSIVETSSIALKENVNPITGALAAIMSLEGVIYDRKDGSSKREAGLIKEEVEKILPNLVKGEGVHYTKLTAYLIEAVKELSAEVTKLKSKNN